jgi:hypothetical protein
MLRPDRLLARLALAAVLGAAISSAGSAQARPRGVGAKERSLEPVADTAGLSPAEQTAVLKRVAPYRAKIRYEAIYNGGKISLGAVRADSTEIAAIRSYLNDMTRAFRRNDFARYYQTKGALPGAKGIVARQGFIVYEFQPMPWGGIVFLLTGDNAARDAIREFIQHQRAINTPS